MVSNAAVELSNALGADDGLLLGEVLGLQLSEKTRGNAWWRRRAGTWAIRRRSCRRHTGILVRRGASVDTLLGEALGKELGGSIGTDGGLLLGKVLGLVLGAKFGNTLVDAEGLYLGLSGSARLDLVLSDGEALGNIGGAWFGRSESAGERRRAVTWAIRPENAWVFETVSDVAVKLGVLFGAVNGLSRREALAGAALGEGLWQRAG